MAEQKTTTLDNLCYRLQVTRPVWLPYNGIAHNPVVALVGHFGYPTVSVRSDCSAADWRALLMPIVVDRHYGASDGDEKGQ